MIIVHYENGSRYVENENRWDKVPNKAGIKEVEVRGLDGKKHFMAKPAGRRVVFCVQRIGYSFHAGGGVKNVPFGGEQVIMFLNKAGDCEVMEVDENGEKRYTTDLKGLGFNDLSLRMLGISLDSLEVHE